MGRGNDFEMDHQPRFCHVSKVWFGSEPQMTDIFGLGVFLGPQWSLKRWVLPETVGWSF